MTTPAPHSDPPAWHLPQTGDVIGEKYRVERVLGVGGMGAVMEVSHVELGQRMAVKVMLPGLSENAKNTQRFLREGRAAAALRSEHAARIVDVGKDKEGAPFLVMELLEGADLERLVRHEGPQPIADAVGYMLQACDAIAEAHALGIIHRDLKPSNLFLVRKEGTLPSIKVLDFGISKETKLNSTELEQQGLTATDSTLGSPRYMSPEQLRDARRVDARTDIWSLGMILHWLLTGTLAFEAETLGEHLMMMVSEPPTPLRARRPDAPAELEAVVRRCLERPVEQRFQDIGEFALALEPFAPPWARPLVPRIIGTLDRAAPAPASRSRAPGSLPSAAGTPAPSDMLTRLSWTERGAAGAKRRGVWQRLLIGAGVLCAAGIAAVSLQRLTAAAGGGEAMPIVDASPASSAEHRPAAPPPTAPPAPPVEPPAAAEFVEITLRIKPAQAKVELDGAPVEGGVVRLPKGEKAHTMVVSADGYRPEKRTLAARESQALRIELQRASAPQATSRAQTSRPPPLPAAPPPEVEKPAVTNFKGPLERQL